MLSAWYAALVWGPAHRPLWYDELFTFYIAQQPALSRLSAALHTIDLNPPLNYLLARGSIAVFGATPWATRLPAIFAFWLGSFAIFLLVRRRATALIAGIAVLLFWSTPYFSFATEARPYGLLLGLTAVLVAAWDAARSSHRVWAVAAIAVSGCLLLLSHVFGVLSLGAVIVAELVRAGRAKKLDLPVLLALLAPLVLTFTYRPLLHSAVAIVFPPEAAVTWGKLYYLYFSIFRWMWRPLLAIAILVLFRRNKERTTEGQALSYDFDVLLSLLFLVPVALTIIFLRSHGAFYERYGMVAVLPIVIVIPLLIRRFTAGDPAAATRCFAAVAVLLLFSTSLRSPIQHATAAMLPPKPALKVSSLLMTSPHGPFRPWFHNLPVPAHLLAERQQAPLVFMKYFRPDLPIVAASELTFFELDQRQPEAVVGRLFYLYDRAAELQIAHRSIADGVLNALQFFPVRSKVEPYQGFLAAHREFLVIATYEHPGDWLLRELEQDGATLHIVGRVSGYADSDLYLVTH